MMAAASIMGRSPAGGADELQEGHFLIRNVPILIAIGVGAVVEIFLALVEGVGDIGFLHRFTHVFRPHELAWSAAWQPIPELGVSAELTWALWSAAASPNWAALEGRFGDVIIPAVGVRATVHPGVELLGGGHHLRDRNRPTITSHEHEALEAGRRVELVDCKTVPLKVPAEAEIVIEGHVSLDDYGDEGPYGDHTGYYNSVEQFPVFTISAITMRRDPIYLSTFTGRPPDEPSVLGEALNEVFIPLLTQQFPEIVDFWLPPEGCSYRIAVVSMRKAYPGHAKRVMMGVWSFLRQFMYTKFVIVVDDDIDARDWKDVMWAISTRMDPVRDITMVESTPIDYLDFASPESGLGGKIGLDATNKLPPETKREWGKKIRMADDVVELVTRKWSSYGLPGSGKSIWR